jgi:hypothetical protein
MTKRERRYLKRGKKGFAYGRTKFLGMVFYDQYGNPDLVKPSPEVKQHIENYLNRK